MKKAVQFLTLSASILLLVSFTGKKTEEFIGTYGVSASDPAQIKLSIHADHTFYYQDFSVSDRKIMVTGRWEVKGRKVVLTDSDSETKFHDVWTFAESGQVARSRKGLSFYRLVRQEG